MSFRIRGLDPAPFRSLYGLPDDALRLAGVTRVVAEARPGYPDRVELVDVAVGAPLLLLNYLHQPGPGPYRSSHAIFVREGAKTAFDAIDRVPEVFRPRMLSVRAFDASHGMRAAALVDGKTVEGTLAELLGDPAHAYLQVHYAVRGCYAARVERAP